MVANIVPKTLRDTCIETVDGWNTWMDSFRATLPNPDERISLGGSYPSGRWYGYLGSGTETAVIEKLLKKYTLTPSQYTIKFQPKAFSLSTNRGSEYTVSQRNATLTLTRYKKQQKDLSYRVRVVADRITEAEALVARLRANPIRRKKSVPLADLVEIALARPDVLDARVAPLQNGIEVLYAPVLFPTAEAVDQVEGGWAVTTPVWIRLISQHPYVVGAGSNEVGHPHLAEGHACVGTASRDLATCGKQNDVAGVLGIIGELRKGWNPQSELGHRIAWPEVAWGVWRKAAAHKKQPEYAAWDGETYQNAYTGEFVKWYDAFGLSWGQREDTQILDCIAHVGTYDKVVYISPLIERLATWNAARTEREAQLALSNISKLPPCSFCNGETEARVSTQTYPCTCHPSNTEDTICKPCKQPAGLGCLCGIVFTAEEYTLLRLWGYWWPVPNLLSTYCNSCLRNTPQARRIIMVRLRESEVSEVGETRCTRRLTAGLRCLPCLGPSAENYLTTDQMKEVTDYVVRRNIGTAVD